MSFRSSSSFSIPPHFFVITLHNGASKTSSIIYSMDDLLNFFFFLEFRTISIDRRKEGKKERGKECLVDR